MILLAPIYLALGLVAALGVVALHLIVTREPPGEILPTARFIPVRRWTVRTIAAVPQDRLLLALRVASLLLIALAFARPQLAVHRVPVVSIVAVDRSRAVGDAREAADSARIALGGVAPTSPGVAANVPPRRRAEDIVGLMIPFDSTASVVDQRAAADTLSQWRASGARGSITVGLIEALRVAADWRERADSIELTVVSPLASDEVDAALDTVRALWPGTIRLVRLATRPLPAEAAGVAPSIDWPADGHPRVSSLRATIDTVGAVAVGDHVVVAPFVRRWQPDTTRARVIARWVDGEPAAVERGAATGCTRDVAIPVDSAGGLQWRPAFRRLASALRSRCGSEAQVASSEARTPYLWPNSDRPSRVPFAAVIGHPSPSTPLSAFLLVLAVIVLLIELAVRPQRVMPRVT